MHTTKYLCHQIPSLNLNLTELKYDSNFQHKSVMKIIRRDQTKRIKTSAETADDAVIMHCFEILIQKKKKKKRRLQQQFF